jgi:diadenosine tetraphosphate (Ap4A) HIT family hydrolase
MRHGAMNIKNDISQYVLRPLSSVFFVFCPLNWAIILFLLVMIIALVIPYQHTARLSDLSEPARLEIMNVVAHTVDLLQDVLRCEAFNIGVNMGEGAKASVPDHLHIHIMPRYKVDAGFAQLIGGTKVVAWNLEELYELLLPLFQCDDCLNGL